MQDQLIIYMALAKGESRMLAGPLTLHTQTAIHIAETIAKVITVFLEKRKSKRSHINFLDIR